MFKVTITWMSGAKVKYRNVIGIIDTTVREELEGQSALSYILRTYAEDFARNGKIRKVVIKREK